MPWLQLVQDTDKFRNLLATEINLWFVLNLYMQTSTTDMNTLCSVCSVERVLVWCIAFAQFA